MPLLHTGIVLSGRVGEVPLGTLVVPLLGVRRQLDAAANGRQLTADLITEATGEAVSAGEVELLIAHPEDIMLSSPRTPTLVRHPADMRWYRGVRMAWVTDLDRSWRPVVCYVVGAVEWERIVPVGMWRLDPSDGAGADRQEPAGSVPTPRPGEPQR